MSGFTCAFCVLRSCGRLAGLALLGLWFFRLLCFRLLFLRGLFLRSLFVGGATIVENLLNGDVGGQRMHGARAVVLGCEEIEVGSGCSGHDEHGDEHGDEDAALSYLVYGLWRCDLIFHAVGFCRWFDADGAPSFICARGFICSLRFYLSLAALNSMVSLSAIVKDVDGWGKIDCYMFQ